MNRAYSRFVPHEFLQLLEKESIVYNHQRLAAGYDPVKNGIGINSGLTMLGTVGGNSHMDSTVISDTVNLAVRIEALTKRYGVPLLISQDTLLRLHEPDAYFYRLIDRVQVKGKSEPVSLFEVFDADPEATRNAKQRLKTQFETALTQLNFTGYSWRLGGGPAPRSLSSEPSRGHSA